MNCPTRLILVALGMAIGIGVAAKGIAQEPTQATEKSVVVNPPAQETAHLTTNRFNAACGCAIGCNLCRLTQSEVCRDCDTCSADYMEDHWEIKTPCNEKACYCKIPAVANEVAEKRQEFNCTNPSAGVDRFHIELDHYRLAFDAESTDDTKFRVAMGGTLKGTPDWYIWAYYDEDQSYTPTAAIYNEADDAAFSITRITGFGNEFSFPITINAGNQQDYRFYHWRVVVRYKMPLNVADPGP